MITLILTLLNIAWLAFIIPVRIAWMLLCTVVWLVWGLFFGVSVGARPVNIGPFRAE